MILSMVYEFISKYMKICFILCIYQLISSQGLLSFWQKKYQRSYYNSPPAAKIFLPEHRQLPEVSVSAISICGEPPGTGSSGMSLSSSSYTALSTFSLLVSPASSGSPRSSISSFSAGGSPGISSSVISGASVSA